MLESCGNCQWGDLCREWSTTGEPDPDSCIRDLASHPAIPDGDTIREARYRAGETPVPLAWRAAS